MNAEIIKKLCGDTEGIMATAAPNVKLFRLTKDMPRQPYLYGPSIIIICQGHKTGHIKGRSIEFGTNSYLVVTGSIPLECEYKASKDNALLGLLVEIDAVTLRSVNETIKRSMRQFSEDSIQELHIVTPVPQTRSIEEVLKRMLQHLQQEETTTLFVQDTIKELYFHFLKGEQNQSLQAMLKNGKFARILAALDYIRSHFDKPMTIETLSKMCHMSPTNFHRSFKDETGDTPLQLIKKTRLSFAKALLEQQKGSVKSIAKDVGYESPSHFSRDFTKLYGYTPGHLLSNSKRDQLRESKKLTGKGVSYD